MTPKIPATKKATPDPDRERFELSLISAQSRLSSPYPLNADGDRMILGDNWRNIVLQWAAKKKWFSKHRICSPYPDGPPYPRAWVKGAEPQGELAYRELELCIQLGAGGCKPYPHSIAWFLACNSGGLDLPWQTKGEVIAFEKWILGQLRQGENPVTQQAMEERLGIPVNPGAIFPTEMLYDRALDWAAGIPRFRSQFWRPYLTAYSRWIKAMEQEDYALLFKHCDRLYLTPRSGPRPIPLPKGY